MRGGPPTRSTWQRALGWQLLLFVQVLLAVIASSLLGAAAYLCIYGVEVLLEVLRIEGFWIEALQRLKGVGFLVASGAYFALEPMHLARVHIHGPLRRKHDA